MPLQTKIGVYKTYLCTRLTYASPICYALCSVKNKQRMQALQNLTLRMCPELCNRPGLQIRRALNSLLSFWRVGCTAKATRTSTRICSTIRTTTDYHGPLRPLSRELLDNINEHKNIYFCNKKDYQRHAKMRPAHAA